MHVHMKISSFAAAAVLLIASVQANAAPSRGYFILESAPPQHIDIFNDGRNTYVDAVPGLIIPGATHDGDRYIIHGLPREINATLSGKAVVITQEFTGTRVAGKGQGALDARIDKLEKAEKSLLSKLGGAAEAQKWDIRADDTSIYATLDRWAKVAGWQIYWDAPEHYTVKVSATFTGSFSDAVNAALRAFMDTKNPLQGCFYEGNKVFRVFPYGQNRLDCQ